MRLVLLFLIAIGSLIGCRRAVPPKLPTSLNIEITGDDFQWYIRYAGADEVLHTEDDLLATRHLTLLAGTPVSIELRSNDYVYSFALPQLNQKEIAVPDLSFSLQFVPSEAGEFALEGDQMCGYQHPDLLGTARVLEPDAYVRWQKSMPLQTHESQKY